jgi:TonB-dependent starch-binding outer membrane protein SusC
MTKLNKGNHLNQAGHSVFNSLSCNLQLWRIMKLINVFLFSCFLNVSANGYTQVVSIARTNASLEDILKDIYKQTGFSYSSRSKDLNEATPITMDVTQVSITTALDIALKNQPLTYILGDKIIIIKRTRRLEQEAKVEAHSIPIKGRVVDEKGDPAEAKIEIQGKGNKYRVGTDKNGIFSIQVNEDDILVISGINFETLVLPVGKKTDLGEIKVITKVTTGEEVLVSTGYEKLKPNQVTGSYSVVGKPKLREQFSTNILQRLNGNAPRLLFLSGKRNAKGQDNPLQLGGPSTINGYTFPLIVLDDIIFTGTIDNINPNDIESVTLLKDAAATSIYGVGGANGVIVITTRKGQLDQKFSMEAGSVVNIAEKTDLYSKPMMQVSDYIEAEELLFNNGYYTNLINLEYAPITPAVDIFNKRQKGLISSTESASRINALKQIDSRDEYNKYFNSAAITQQHYISVSGGSRSIGWLLSGSYDKSLSSQDAFNQKLNLRFNNIYKVLDNLSVTIDGYYTNSRSVTGKPAFGNIIVRNSMYQQYADAYGRPLAVGNTYNINYTNTTGNGQLLDWNYYPLTDYQHDQIKISREQLITNINVNYKLTRFLQLNASYQYQKESSGWRRFSDIESFHTRDLINSFTNLQATSLKDKYPIPLGGIIRMEDYGVKSQNFRFQANFNKSWKRHSVGGIFGNEIREANTLPTVLNSIYGYREHPVDNIPVDYGTSFKNYVYGFGQLVPDAPRIDPSRINRFVSLYGNISWSFEGKYTLSGSFRKDASNIFGVKANDKWNPLWSTGLGWEISKESFYSLQSVLPLLKFRATWGYSGNLDNSKTALPLINYNTNFDLNTVSAWVSQPNNPRLKWEKSRQYNIALNFSIPHQRVSGNIEYYQKKGTDLYGETPYDYTVFGLTNSITQNVANLKTTGVDISLDIKVIDSRKLKWTTSLLYNYNANVTTKYNVPVATDGTMLIGSDGNSMLPVVGKPLYALIAYRWAGLDAKGNPQGYLDGKPSTEYERMMGPSNIYREQIVYMGPAAPTQFGSFANRISWKGLNLSVLISYKLGYYFLRPAFQEISFVNQGIGLIDYQQRWQKPGDERITTVPSFVYPYTPGMDFSLRDRFYKSAEINVPKADNIRVQYINASYDFPKTGKGLIRNLNVYGNIANLGFLWKATKEKIDPDNPTGYRTPKSFTIGLRIQM